ncbi:MAG TPA: VIT family protein [Candidatus Saccharimonadales bacterium]|nr:VIT family protein [Candidatus Saccharimonadales bacterium]
MEEAQISTYKLNWLRAAVLGANDGIVSVASIVVGVAGAHNDRHFIFVAGLAGLVAGAFSMAVGEYVSVSSQRDTERAYIDKEKAELAAHPDEELKELAEMYQAKGLSAATAKQVADELTKHDPVKAHLDVELNLDEEDLTNPTHAAIASAISFTVGALIPLLAILLMPRSTRILATFVAVLVALTITGYLSATVGGASRRKAIFRVIIGGAAAMVGTYYVGHLFGTAVN